MAEPLTARVRLVADCLFDRADLQGALEMIENELTSKACHASGTGNFERIRLAALKLSNGDTGKLVDAIVLAQIDYRDLLMAAGFGRPGLHLEWADQLIDARPG